MSRPLPEKIEMIALDLDGTTLTRGRITPRTRNVLEAAIRRGIHVVIATGRVFTALPDDVFRIEGLRYVLTSNGAILTDLQKQEVIYQNCIGRNPLESVIRILRDHPQFPAEVFTDGQAYIGRNYYEELEQNGPACSYMSRAYVLRTRKPVEDVYEFLESHMETIENINIHFPNDDNRQYLRKLLEAVPEITLTSSMKLNLEVGGASTSKANGLAALSGLTGTSLENTMACGDSPNDMAMLAECGFAAAVSNGEPEILAMADRIIPSNEDEGVAYAVETFVLGIQRPKWQMAVLCRKNRILLFCRQSARKVLWRTSGRR